ncbi:hypothetical protein NIES2135_49480 [Leptolyngbya boryana NIES-2135]|jgi:hypothetical protein|uniref:Uncharacterized protein n=1 Tax=Leptolyngbya boryana NIES-2135 TaxID=1973484 RepID=A0A1Z4JMT3_LEPBY|nr:hypothetical protein NIES2135_49480 [Leptolyngbya boryana NIES-2135]
MFLSKKGTELHAVAQENWAQKSLDQSHELISTASDFEVVDQCQWENH